jgi:signal transduction histidine kinase
MKNRDAHRVPLMNGQAVGLTGETTIADWLQVIRAEYTEVPGLHLTKAEVQDLWGLDAWVSDILLKALVDAGFLRRTRGDAYVRAGAGESRFHLEGHVVDRSSSLADHSATPAQLRDLTRRLVSAKEDERRRIGRELHDDISQRLALLAIGIDRLVQQTPDRNTVRTRLRQLLQHTNEIAKGVHHLSYQLHPFTLEELGIVAALRALSRELSERGLRVVFNSDAAHSEVSTAVALGLFRVAQEALSNVLKHSGVGEATLHFSCSDQVVTIRVEDRGRGFDARAHGGGLGLVSMRERLLQLGGEVAIESRPGEGTAVEARVPLSAA